MVKKNQQEIGAAIVGMSWALELGYMKIILEMESMLTVNWILEKCTPQWSICKMDRLKALFAQLQKIKCTHVFRETNWVADALFKHNHKKSLVRKYITPIKSYLKRQRLTFS